jgi:rhodanese-related sulfurtransferase
MKITIIALLLSICCVIPLEAHTPDTIRYVSLEPYDFHLQYLRADSAILIDVCEPFEFRGRRLREAVNIPSSGNITRAADTLKKHYSLFLYCTTDFRSRKAAEILFDKGFRRLFNLEGGIVAWKKDGMPVVRGSRR